MEQKQSKQARKADKVFFSFLFAMGIQMNLLSSLSVPPPASAHTVHRGDWGDFSQYVSRIPHPSQRHSKVLQLLIQLKINQANKQKPEGLLDNSQINPSIPVF